MKNLNIFRLLLLLMLSFFAAACSPPKCADSINKVLGIFSGERICESLARKDGSVKCEAFTAKMTEACQVSGKVTEQCIPDSNSVGSAAAEALIAVSPKEDKNKDEIKKQVVNLFDEEIRKGNGLDVAAYNRKCRF
jgi:hypothetical protein